MIQCGIQTCQVRIEFLGIYDWLAVSVCVHYILIFVEVSDSTHRAVIIPRMIPLGKLPALKFG